MIRRTLLALVLLTAPAIVVAQQPSPMQGQTSADSSKAKAAAKPHGKKKHAAKHKAKAGAKPAAKPDTGMAKP
jgi:hypothetical protein